MIPVFDVAIEIDYDIEALQQDLTAEDVAAGFAEHRDYEPMGMPDWQSVADCLRDEHGFLMRARENEAHDGIEALLDELSDEDAVEYAQLTAGVFNGNDPGAAGLCMALSAALTATFYSCSGGQAGRHHADYPTVGVLPDPQRARRLLPLIAAAGCGVEQHSGRWYIYSDSVERLHALGRAVLEAREDFDAMPVPGWVDGLEEALDEARDY